MDLKMIKMIASKLEHGCGTLPKPTEAERMKVNRNIWEFKLSLEDMKKRMMEEVLSAWWDKRYNQVFSSLPVR